MHLQLYHKGVDGMYDVNKDIETAIEIMREYNNISDFLTISKIDRSFRSIEKARDRYIRCKLDERPVTEFDSELLKELEIQLNRLVGNDIILANRLQDENYNNSIIINKSWVNDGLYPREKVDKNE